MIESLLGFCALFAIVFFGVPLGFALLIVGFLGFAYLRGFGPAIFMSGQQVVEFGANYGFSVLPMFILMGTLIHRSRLSEELYDAANSWLGHFRGGLAMATIAACGAFSAVSGSSLATAATMSKVAMPPMRRYGYSKTLATGSIAAGGTLGILIPPSVPLVIYGILTESNIGKLFIAGIVPGLVLILAFIGTVWLLTLIRPDLGPAGKRATFAERFRQLRGVFAIGLLFVIILGGIYFSIFTPTEAAGIGAAGALFFTLIRRRLTWRVFHGSLVEAGITTGMIFVVVFGAMVFSNFVNVAGPTRTLVNLIQALDFSPVGVVLVMCAVYLVIGCIFDSLAMMLLLVPIFTSILQPLGVDLIWFGIVTIIAIEIGLITPPIGMNVVIVKSVISDVDVWEIFRGVIPFIIASVVVLGLVIFFPFIATGILTLI